MTTPCTETRKPDHVQCLRVEYGSPTDILGKPFKIFTKFVKVFDLFTVATEAVPDSKLLHCASVLYQYIDNRDDGVPDNPKAYAALLERNATMVMFEDKRELKKKFKRFSRANDKCKNVLVQDCQAHETRPGSLMPHEFDASLEECFHLVTEGYAMAYPDVFGLNKRSFVGTLLDNARGGYFKKVPKRYPKDAWFTYYDKTCCYGCMATEYLYWAMTTILGAQELRGESKRHEWRPYTCDKLIQTDRVVYLLLTNPMYMLPTKLPVPLDCVPLHKHRRKSSGSSSGSSSSSSSGSSSSSSSGSSSSSSSGSD